MNDLHHMRHEYYHDDLSQADLRTDPLQQFETWFQEAIARGQSEANAMTLATYHPAQRRPHARIVLLKAFDPAGFVFFTHYDSQKGLDLEACPYAELLFWWPIMARQIRIGGLVQRTTAEQSSKYFHERPKGAQLAASISPQSQTIPSRQSLIDDYQTMAARYPDNDETVSIPCPKAWGGYRVIPDYFEFWQGRENRLHDRFTYTQVDPALKRWQINRLAP